VSGSAAVSARRFRRRWAVTLTIVTISAVGVGIGAGSVGREADPAEPMLRLGDGTTAPAFQLPDLRSPARTVDLAQFAGRPVVLNFWASWCVPCRTEMPALEAVQRRLGDGVAFLGVNHQDSRTAALQLVDDTGVTYPSGMDPEGQVARAYELVGLPATVLITPDGDLVATRLGAVDADELDLMIDELLLT
jgi:thiol-disulfide isomerase/thioredoxin